MMAAELASTAAEEMSVFQRLSLGNGRKLLSEAPWPTDIWLHAEVCVEPLTWRFCAEELLLPGSGFCTVTEKVPAEVALPVAVSCVEETKVVASAVVPTRTCAPEMKLLPVTMSV